jgi:hypothetical protein
MAAATPDDAAGRYDWGATGNDGEPVRPLRRLGRAWLVGWPLWRPSICHGIRASLENDLPSASCRPHSPPPPPVTSTLGRTSCSRRWQPSNSIRQSTTSTWASSHSSTRWGRRTLARFVNSLSMSHKNSYPDRINAHTHNLLTRTSTRLTKGCPVSQNDHNTHTDDTFDSRRC